MARILKNKPSHHPLTRFLNSPTPTFYTSTRSLQTLAYEEVRSSTDKPHTSTAFVVHGLLGSGRNWRSFSRNLASSSPSDWRFVLVDLRNHGRSAEIEGLNQPHDLVNSANDLANLVKSKGWDWPRVVVGHSLGGKIALQFAHSCARGDYGPSVALPKQLWVLDSVPGEVKPENSDGEVEKVLQTLQSLPSSVPSRKWLVNHMTELGFSRSLSEWIGSNLKKSGEHETWAFNLEGAVQMFNSYREMSYWPLLEHPPKGMEIAIVRADKSDRWDPDVIQRLESLASRGGDASEGSLLQWSPTAPPSSSSTINNSTLEPTKSDTIKLYPHKHTKSLHFENTSISELGSLPGFLIIPEARNSDKLYQARMRRRQSK